MKFLDQAKISSPLAQEVTAPSRSGVRSSSSSAVPMAATAAKAATMARMRRQSQHADRLPLPTALQGAERPGRHGPEPLRCFRQVRGGCGAAG